VVKVGNGHRGHCGQHKSAGKMCQFCLTH
jgi:hypothetical protein